MHWIPDSSGYFDCICFDLHQIINIINIMNNQHFDNAVDPRDEECWQQNAALRNSHSLSMKFRKKHNPVEFKSPIK